MEIRTVKTARKRIIWIILLSILCLILISFLPWISVAENGMLKENLNFNYEMMKASYNPEITELARNLMLIYILFWTIIIIGLISFLFITYFALVKSSLIGQVIVLTSAFIIFVLSLLIIYFQIIFSRSINDIDYISASMINSNFAYPYIQFIINIILIVYSATYATILLKDSIKQFIKSPRQKKKEIEKIDENNLIKKFEKKEIVTSIKGINTNKPSLDSDREAKLVEIEKMLAKKAQSTDELKIDENIQKQDFNKDKQIDLPSDKKTFFVEEEKQKENDKDNKTKTQEDKSSIEPFPTKKPKEKSEDTDEIRFSKNFEDALDSAIKKKQSNIKQEENKLKEVKEKKSVAPKQIEQKQEKVEPIFQTEKILLEKKGNKIEKIYNVKCPECNHIFPFDIKGDKNKIKCPKCGKEGTSKEEF